jgi:hypothetical protein
MGDTLDPKFGNAVALGPFTAANVTTGAADQDLALASAGTTITMLGAGSVIGLSLEPVGTVTGGSITAKVHKASTELANTPAPVSDETNTLGTYATKRPGMVRFAAGDKLGVSVSSTTTLAPTNTVDVAAVLYVVYDPQ